MQWNLNTWNKYKMHKIIDGKICNYHYLLSHVGSQMNMEKHLQRWSMHELPNIWNPCLVAHRAFANENASDYKWMAHVAFAYALMAHGPLKWSKLLTSFAVLSCTCPVRWPWWPRLPKSLLSMAWVAFKKNGHCLLEPAAGSLSSKNVFLGLPLGAPGLCTCHSWLGSIFSMC